MQNTLNLYFTRAGSSQEFIPLNGMEDEVWVLF